MDRVLIFLIFNLITIGVIAQNESDIIKIGDQLPSFKLESSKGVINSRDLKGKVVLINFFATWCPSCVKELPHIEQKVWKKYKSNPDFKLLVVGREHTEKELSSFSKEKYTMPFYPDEGRKVYQLFAHNTIPRCYVVDKKGVVVYALTGFSEESFKEMLDVVEDLID